MTYRRRLLTYSACASALWLCVLVWLWSRIDTVPTQFVPQRQDVTLIGMFDWVTVVTERQPGSARTVYTTDLLFSAPGVIYSAAVSMLLALAAMLSVRYLVTTQSLPPEFCDRCGYHLRGIEMTRCPECGSQQPTRSPRTMTPLRQAVAWRAIVAVTLFTAGYTIQLAASRVTLLDVHESLSGTALIPNAAQWSQLLAAAAEVVFWLSAIWIIIAAVTLYPYRKSVTSSR